MISTSDECVSTAWPVRAVTVRERFLSAVTDRFLMVSVLRWHLAHPRTAV